VPNTSYGYYWDRNSVAQHFALHPAGIALPSRWCFCILVLVIKFILIYLLNAILSLLWHCEVGDRKNIQHIKILHKQSLWKIFGERGLTQSNLWNIEQKLKVVIVVVITWCIHTAILLSSFKWFSSRSNQRNLCIYKKQMKGSVKELNKFHNYETEKITRKASDVAEYIDLFGSSTRDHHHAWRI